MDALEQHIPHHAWHHPIHGIAAYRAMRKKTGMAGWNSKAIEVRYLLQYRPAMNDDEAEAKKNLRTQNAEIVMAIRQQMKKEMPAQAGE